MRKICNKCLEEYKDNLLSMADNDLFDNISFCPKIDCQGAVIDFKDEDVPILKILFDKGYEVVDLHSGGIEEKLSSVAYIQLKNFRGKMPEGFGLVNPEKLKGLTEEEKNATKNVQIFLSKAEANSEIDLAEQIIYCQLAMIDWAKELPNLKEKVSDLVKPYGNTETQKRFKKIMDDLFKEDDAKD